jgi:hypothetical protein
VNKLSFPASREAAALGNDEISAEEAGSDRHGGVRSALTLVLSRRSDIARHRVEELLQDRERAAARRCLARLEIDDTAIGQRVVLNAHHLSVAAEFDGQDISLGGARREERVLLNLRGDVVPRVAAEGRERRGLAELHRHHVLGVRADLDVADCFLVGDIAALVLDRGTGCGAKNHCSKHNDGERAHPNPPRPLLGGRTAARSSG